MKNDCEASYHDFVVVNWVVTAHSRQARELLCNNCLLLVDLSQIRAESCSYKKKPCHQAEEHHDVSPIDVDALIAES